MRWKLVVTVAAATIALGLVIYKRPRLTDPIPPPQQTRSLSTRHGVAPLLPAPRLSVSSPPIDPSPEGLSHTNLIARLLKSEEVPRLSAEQVQSYLEKNHRSVGSLLAAFHATDDRTFLREAMEKYPADPRLDLGLTQVCQPIGVAPGQPVEPVPVAADRGVEKATQLRTRDFRTNHM